MSFRQFTEGACDQSNPTEELASHVTRDNAHRDTINLLPSTSLNEFMSKMPIAPQTCRIDDLLRKIRNISSKSVTPGDSRAAEYRNQLDQSNDSESIRSAQEAKWFNTTASTHTSYDQNYAYPWSSTCERNRMPDLEMFNMNEALPVYNLHNKKDCEELLKYVKESQEKNFESNDDMVQPQNNDTKPKKKNKFIYFNGLCTEDVHKADTPDIEWSNSENFVRFLTNYIKSFQRRDFDLNVKTEYKFSKKNPYDDTVCEPHSRGLWYLENHHPLHAILYFEAAVRVNQNDTQAWKYLVDVLMHNGQYYDAFCLAKKNLHQNLHYFSMIIYNFLFDEQHHYQGCQAILNWLRSHPDYHVVVPSNYMMEDKTSTLVEDKQVAELKVMLIVTTWRKPNQPDNYVSIALSKLYEISRDYKKSNDYILDAIQNRTKRQWQNWINLLYNLIRDNEPTQALVILKSLNKKECSYSFRINCHNVTGIVNMYLGNYKKAGQYFLTTLDLLIVWKTLEVCHLRKDTVLSELRLCIELMHRPDLLNLVDEINLKKLCKEFNYNSIV